MKTLLSILLVLVFASCNPQNGVTDEREDRTNGDWLIPKEEIFDGGPGKDGIPSIDAPRFISASEVDFLNDSDLVIAVAYKGETRIYPHPILDWHEIVNDEIQDLVFALTYCPLTGTAINWKREINGEKTTFGVSGLLYNSNLIPYDRKTGSNWSQIRLDCVNGENQGLEIQTLPVFEGPWNLVKDIDGIKVLSTETGFSRNYGTYPYGDYRTNHNNLIFPVSSSDDRKNAKERVLGIFGNRQPTIFSFSDFSGSSDEILEYEINSREVIVVGNKSKNYITAFYKVADRTYEPIVGDFPHILRDDLGHIYDVFGNSEAGISPLLQPEQFIGYWFSWAAFYPDLVLFQN